MSEDKNNNEVIVVETQPFNDQKPGTSGLRKKVKVFEQANYLENFVQSIFDALDANALTGSTLVVSGDGRYYNKQASMTILRMCAANGVAKVIVGKNFLVSTPAVSQIIRQNKAFGGILLTASHNPGGPHEDFGIKYNIANGGPAPEKITDKIFENTKKIKQYKIHAQTPQFDASSVGVHKLGNMEIEVVDATEAYAKYMATIFDFESLRAFIQRKDFSFIFDAMYGVAGPFAERIFCGELGASADVLMNAVPHEDFNGGHPDPNLTYAEALVKKMDLHEQSDDKQSVPAFGAAADGDADRNMILGKHFFVTPSDSVAIIAANAAQSIPYFKNGLKGLARSMPTSQALDRVAAKLNVPNYEVPTGWKFFGNLMDAEKLSICGEESFGTGSDHIREKDGLWAVLCWLSLLQYKNANQPRDSPLIGVKEITHEHWKTYGRNYYSRYDYENVDAVGANKLMQELNESIRNNSLEIKDDQFVLDKADNFAYTDPVDHSVSENQGIRIMFKDGSRIVFRLSGTGSVGATIRMYVEKYEDHPDKLFQDTQAALAPLIQLALKLSKIKEHTGRDAPTVIT